MATVVVMSIIFAAQPHERVILHPNLGDSPTKAWKFAKKVLLSLSKESN